MFCCESVYLYNAPRAICLVLHRIKTFCYFYDFEVHTCAYMYDKLVKISTLSGQLVYSLNYRYSWIHRSSDTKLNTWTFIMKRVSKFKIFETRCLMKHCYKVFLTDAYDKRRDLYWISSSREPILDGEITRQVTSLLKALQAKIFFRKVFEAIKVRRGYQKGVPTWRPATSFEN